MSVAISGPLKEQWGYLFVDEFGKEADKQKHYRTLSHELGHGRTALPHTFKDEHLSQGSTNNLMDYPSGNYPNGTDLVRAQWDMAHNPAIFTPLQSDGDGATVLFTGTIENGELKGDNIMIGSHTFFTPAGYPITFPIEETLIIKKSSFESYILDENDKEVKNIHVPSGALFKFNYDGANYFAHYKTKILEGTTEFVGYRKEGTVDTYYQEPSKLTENLALPFDVNYFNNGSLNTVKSDFCIKCPTLCSSNLSNYRGDGPLASSISLLPLDYETYINSKFNQSTVLVNAIRSNPCVLLGMRSFGMIPPQSEWMDDMNQLVAVGLMAAFSPAILEIAFVPMAEGLIESGAAFWNNPAVNQFVTNAAKQALKKLGPQFSLQLVKDKGITALNEFITELSFQVLFSSLFEESPSVNIASLTTNVAQSLTLNNNWKNASACLYGLLFDNDGKVKSIEELTNIQDQLADCFQEAFIEMLAKVVDNDAIKQRVKAFIDGPRAWRFFDKLEKWGVSESGQWNFIQLFNLSNNAIAYMASGYTEKSFKEFTRVVLFEHYNVVVVVGGNNKEMIIAEQDHVKTVVPDRTVIHFEFTQSELQALQPFFEEWEQKLNIPTFDREEFMSRFLNTNGMVRYNQFLEANKDNSFIDVGQYDGVYQNLNTIPDPVYYHELKKIFDGKTKYEFRQATRF